VGYRGGSGLLVDEELARAVRLESADAVMFWWGVTSKAIWHWRRALGVTRTNNPSSHALNVAAANRGLQASLERGVTAAERRQRSRSACRLNLVRFARSVPPARRPWKPAELAMLGTAADEEVAAKIGRTVSAVRVMRQRRGRATARDRRRRDC
jgi:hypothetical protein